MNIELNDILVFEDEVGNIYQDCVCEITNYNSFVVDYICNRYVYREGVCLFTYYIDGNNSLVYDKEIYDKEIKAKLKEIWHRTDEDTYKKVWSK